MADRFTMKNVLLLLFIVQTTFGELTIETGDGKEYQRVDFIVDLIKFNLKNNGWRNLIFMGPLPDIFYDKINQLHYTMTISDIENDDESVDDTVPYHSNMILISCSNFDEFEKAFLKLMASPYWNPLSNTILYYQTAEQDDIAKIFFIFWYHRAANAIIAQYDDTQNSLAVSYYNPYISENFQLQHSFGCWKATKVGRPIARFKDSFVCEEGCHNVSLHSKLRAIHLGTCIGFETRIVRYSDNYTVLGMNLFQDKGKNLHGFILRAFGLEVEPFLLITEHDNGSYSFHCRDGMLWTLTSKLMNFNIDLTPSKDTIKEPFNFETNIQQIYTFARRQADLIIFPIYQFDVVFVELDLSIAYKDSGVCILSHRADFETILFDVKLLQDNYMLVVRFTLCFVCIWFLFIAFNVSEHGRFDLDQVGKDFVNTIRNVLSISLCNPPRRQSFRLFLTVSIWSFFVISFATQAAIISFFSSIKRGKDVDTFDDVIEKGYIVEGMASPDMMLPDDEERFRKINSKLVPIQDLFECVNRINIDSRRFCLIDCSVGRYLERNKLNNKGVQYIHIAKDRIHSHYLNMIFHKHSTLTDTFNKYIRIFFEAGLIKKWEQYRYTDIKEEAPIKSLAMEDLIGIFKCYLFLLGFSSAVFVLEISVGVAGRVKSYIRMKIAKWKRTRAARMKLNLERKLGNIRFANTSTQTIVSTY